MRLKVLEWKWGVTDLPEAPRVLRYLPNLPSENVEPGNGEFIHSRQLLSTFWVVANAGVGAWSKTHLKHMLL